MELEPFQKPHPPLWYGVISPDSAARAARAGMNIIANTTATVFRSFADRYCATYQPPSGSAETPRMGINRYIVLAEDEDTALNIARRAYRPWYAHFMALWHKYDKHPGVNYPPEIDGQLADGRAIATTPAKALSSLRTQLAESGANYLVLRFAFGDLSLSESLRSLELFQRHVMPGLRESVAVAAE
jgi:alkanesulfonate monooxygenase SsuD/methylene tetrahydromethanopterin reductase-like flavin-dependent oxidoreductase (luciferase family)